MLDFVFCCALFTAGIISAWVDWNSLTRSFLKFDDMVKVKQAIISNETGLPTG